MSRKKRKKSSFAKWNKNDIFKKKEEEKIDSCANFYKDRNNFVGFKTVDTPKLRDIKTSYAVAKVGNVEVDTDPILLIPNKIYHQIMTFTKLLNVEITGLGTIKLLGDNILQVEDLFILEQTVSGGQCEIKPESMVKLMEKMITENKSPGDLKFWWHSHNSMGAFWSETDTSTGKNYGGKDYLVSLVTNHNSEMRAKVNIFSPIEVEIDNIEIRVEGVGVNNEIIEYCKKEIIDKVKEESYQNNTNYNPCYGDYSNYNPYGNVNDNTIDNDFNDFKDDIDDDSGPLGDFFSQQTDKGEVRYIWSKLLKKYVAYDGATNLQLTDAQAIEWTGEDFNSPQFLEDDFADIDESELTGYER